eukprot:1053309-Amphidinium_carterae.1
MDRKIVLTAAQPNGHALECASEALRADREVVLSVVRQNGYALKYASETLRADREIALAAVRKDGCALYYASEALSGDREVVLAAAQQDGGALQYAADELLEDATFAKEAKSLFYLLKLTMLSGRSTVVSARPFEDVDDVLANCRRRLGLADDRATMELWDGPNRVQDETWMFRWPGIKPQ